MSDFLIQALGFVPSFIAFTSLQSGNRKRILVLQFVCCIMWFAHYALLGAVTIMFTNVIGIARATLCYYNDRKWAQSRVFPVILIVCYWVSAALTWDGAASLLPTLAMSLTTIGLWSHNMRLTRLLFLINSPMMLAADIITGSIACTIVESMALVSFAVAVYRFDIRPKHKKLETAEN